MLKGLQKKTLKENRLSGVSSCGQMQMVKIETCMEDSFPLISKHSHLGCFPPRTKAARPPTSDSSNLRFAFAADLSQHSPGTRSKGRDGGFPFLSPKTGFRKDNSQSCSAWKVREGMGRRGQSDQTSNVRPVDTPSKALSH